MHKHLVINSKFFTTKFDMDSSIFKLSVESFSKYTKYLAINILFPYSTLKDSSGKLTITSLSLEDKILCYTIYKVILPQITNFTQILEEKLFLMWIIKS